MAYQNLCTVARQVCSRSFLMPNPNCPNCGKFATLIRQEFEDEGLCEFYFVCIPCEIESGEDTFV